MSLEFIVAIDEGPLALVHGSHGYDGATIVNEIAVGYHVAQDIVGQKPGLESEILSLRIIGTDPTSINYLKQQQRISGNPALTHPEVASPNFLWNGIIVENPNGVPGKIILMQFYAWADIEALNDLFMQGAGRLHSQLPNLEIADLALYPIPEIMPSTQSQQGVINAIGGYAVYKSMELFYRGQQLFYKSVGVVANLLHTDK
jgi:hypothetical protein